MSNIPAETDLPTRPTSCGGSFPTRTSSRPAASRRPQTDHVYALHLYRKIIACSLRSILSLLIRAPSRNDTISKRHRRENVFPASGTLASPLRSKEKGDRGGESEIPKVGRGEGERAIAEIRSAYGCSPTPRMLALSGPWGPEGEGDARRREAAGGFPGMRRDGRTNGRPSGEHGGIAPTISTSPCINITLTPSFLRETCPNGRNCRELCASSFRLFAN